MSNKVRRNALCPCGSGKKYKKCCMANVREHTAETLSRRDGVMQALTWVGQHYKEATDRWVEDVWLADIIDVQRAGIISADTRIRSIHDVNLLEMLVAEGEFSEMEGEARPLQLILNTTDLQLSALQREYLTQLSERPLRMYRTIACRPGESFTVSDALDGGAECVISDVYGSQMLDVGDVVGLRLMETSGGWETSGSIYHIPDQYVDELEAQLRDAEGDKYSAVLTHFWLKLVAAHV